MQDFDLKPYLSQIVFPHKNGVKGDNGRVLVIGGSRLFHAAPFWAASMASRIVDMVHFSSPILENNDLMRVKAKEHFWDGIVVPYKEIDHYINEDDSLLIGPGMERGEETRKIVNTLLIKYPAKKWVVDGGALQEVDPSLLTPTMIVTPNIKELSLLNSKLPNYPITQLPFTTLSKGPTDTIRLGNEAMSISGGSPGMTKGGTGDVLAGLVAGFYAKSSAFTSCVVASYLNKLASEELEHSTGPFFSPEGLIKQIPISLHRLLESSK